LELLKEKELLLEEVKKDTWWDDLREYGGWVLYSILMGLMGFLIWAILADYW
jgi:hypothetical protein